MIRHKQPARKPRHMRRAPSLPACALLLSAGLAHAAPAKTATPQTPTTSVPAPPAATPPAATATDSSKTLTAALTKAAQKGKDALANTSADYEAADSLQKLLQTAATPADTLSISAKIKTLRGLDAILTNVQTLQTSLIKEGATSADLGLAATALTKAISDAADSTDAGVKTALTTATQTQSDVSARLTAIQTLSGTGDGGLTKAAGDMAAAVAKVSGALNSEAAANPINGLGATETEPCCA